MHLPVPPLLDLLGKPPHRDHLCHQPLLKAIFLVCSAASQAPAFSATRPTNSKRLHLTRAFLKATRPAVKTEMRWVTEEAILFHPKDAVFFQVVTDFQARSSRDSSGSPQVLWWQKAFALLRKHGSVVLRMKRDNCEDVMFTPERPGVCGC